MGCKYGYGICKTPWGECPHWQEIFCELDFTKKNGFRIYQMRMK